MDAHPFPDDYARRWWPGCIGAWYDAHYREDGSCVPGTTQYALYQGGVRRPSPEHEPFPFAPDDGGPAATAAAVTASWVAVVDDDRSDVGEPLRARVAAEAGPGRCPRCHEPWESRYLTSHQRGLRCRVKWGALRARLAGLEEAAWYHGPALARAGIPHFLTWVPGASPFSGRPARLAVYTLPGACAVLRSTRRGRGREVALRRFREDELAGALRAMPSVEGSP
jgi:hypothetical protein